MFVALLVVHALAAVGMPIADALWCAMAGIPAVASSVIVTCTLARGWAIDWSVSHGP